MTRLIHAKKSKKSIISPAVGGLIQLGLVSLYPFGRDARVAEWGGLENRYTRKGIESSNLSLSA
jgi:hypothetical protein